MPALPTLVLPAAALALMVAPALAQDGDDALTPLDRKVMTELTDLQETANIVFHYRPGDLDRARLAKVVQVNLEKYHHLEKLLKMEYRGHIHLFLYRDIADLQKMTGSSAVALSTGTVSVHQAQDFQSVHELTHIFALQFPRDEDAVTDGFTVEGLATTLRARIAFIMPGRPMRRPAGWSTWPRSAVGARRGLCRE